MRQAKRQQYIDNLQAGIHTLSGKADQIDEAAAGAEIMIKSCFPKKVRGQDRREYYLQINPNKAGSGKMIRSYKQFTEIFFGMLERINAAGFRVTRADLAIDSDNAGDYELFQKLNKLLLCCLADEYEIKNCYHTRDLWSNKSLSVAIKNDVIEAENYDKSREAGEKSDVKNRLELRSKRMTKSIDQEFLIKWFDRLDKAVDHFQAVQDRYNAELLRIWKDDQQQQPKQREYLNLTAFLMQYRDCIFTRSQLQRLLESMGMENPKQKAKNFKDRHSIEFFSLADVKAVIGGIKAAMIRYFTM